MSNRFLIFFFSLTSLILCLEASDKNGPLKSSPQITDNDDDKEDLIVFEDDTFEDQEEIDEEEDLDSSTFLDSLD